MRRRTADEYDLSRIERTQTERTLNRRSERSRRKRNVVLVTLLCVGLLVVAAPSLLSHSSMGRSLLTQNMAAYGWQADAESIQVGWVTPARVTGLKMIGERAGSSIEIGELQTTLTLPQLISGEVTHGRFGEVWLNDVTIGCRIGDQTSSIEEDLIDFLAPAEKPSTVRPEGNVQVQGLHIQMTDAVTGAAWTIKQANASAIITPDALQSKWQGVLSQPGGNDGSLQGSLTCSMQTDFLPASLQIESDSLPMSVLSLVARRFPESQLPAEVTGDLSGIANLELPKSGYPSVSLRKIELRDLAAYDTRTRQRLWNNSLTQINGDAVWQPGRIIARQINAKTDFASLSIDGSFADTITLSGSQSNPLVWLDQVDATANVEIDLPRMQAALPGLLPLREGASLNRGVVRASIVPMNLNDPRDPVRRRRFIMQSDVVEATADGKLIRIAPMDATAIVASDTTQLRAEQFEMTSPFAQIRGQGDLASGSADVDIHFGRLTQLLQPIFELEGQDLQGDVRANLRWDSEANGLWRLRGESNIKDLALQVAPQQSLQQSEIVSAIDIEGRWSVRAGKWSLDELSRGTVNLSGDGFQTDMELVQTIRNLNSTRMIPMRVRGQGQLESIIEMASPWMPDSVLGCRGAMNFTARASFNGNGELDLQTVDGQLTSVRIPMADRDWQQEIVKLHFDGQALWPRQEVVIRSATMTGDAVSAAMQGEWINSMLDMEVAWRANLDRLQDATPQRLARDKARPFPAGFASNAQQRAQPETHWKVQGQLEGNTTFVGDTATVHIDTKMSGRDLELLEVGRVTTSVWSEPAMQIDGKLQFDVAKSSVNAETLQLATDWCGATLSGTASYFHEIADVQLRGPARFKMDQVSRRLTTLSGTTIVAEGLHETPLEIMYAQNKQSEYAFTVKGNLGWETVDTAGMLFGPAEVPFRMTEDTVTIQPSRIPVLGSSRLTQRSIGPQLAPLEPLPNAIGSADGQGELLIAGDVHYRPELRIDVAPGPIARNVTLTPDMTEKWLKYLAPIASDAALVQGRFGAELQQATLYIDDPKRSQIRGRLDIEQVRMNAGPLADQVIAGARQLQALASIGSNVRPASTGSTLVTLPAQSVEFQVSQGVVDHRALMFDVDRARVITSGQVDLDGRLNLTAQIPLDAKWLGRDLRSLSGQTMTLPINGTLSQPRLDSAGIQKVVADLGTRAVQNVAQEAAGNFLQEQFGRGQQQLEQGLNKSLEKFRIDKLFGN